MSSSVALSTVSTLKKPGWRETFIAALAACPDVTAACEAAGVHRSLVYRLREKHQGFAQAWDSAVGASVDRLEAVAFRRAEETSDVLTIFLLKAHKPERYRETSRLEHSGADGGPVRVVLSWPEQSDANA